VRDWAASICTQNLLGKKLKGFAGVDHGWGFILLSIKNSEKEYTQEGLFVKDRLSEPSYTAAWCFSPTKVRAQGAWYHFVGHFARFHPRPNAAPLVEQNTQWVICSCLNRVHLSVVAPCASDD